MNKYTSTVDRDMGSLADDARSLLAATASVTEEKVVEARKRFTAALDQGKELYGALKDKAAEGAKTVDKTVRDYPYQTLTAAFAVGALVGCLLARRN